MKKTVLLLLITISSLFAEVTNEWATAAFADKGIKIIDIRTPAEWVETGVVKGSYEIMFFDEKGNYNIQSFLAKVAKVVKKDEQFAIICRVGSRSGMVSEFLSENLGYNVINLKGGIMKMIRDGYRPVKYKK
ncbi:MAG: rhodanese-like domain-containing protein [Sulfurovum sp.]